MFRSQSGPGLSINTASANSLAVPSTQAPPTGSLSKSLFGSSTFQPQAATPNLGNSQSQSNSTQQGGKGLFGVQTGGTNMFGLGNTQQSQSQSQAPSQTGSGLFAPASGQTQSQASNTGIFGGMPATNLKTSLFGNAQNTSQSQISMAPPPPPTLFSTTIGQRIQQQQTVPGVRISVNELRPTTRFNDLHEELQKAIEYVDNFILGQIQFQEQCAAGNEGVRSLCSEMPADIGHCERQLDTVQRALEDDAESIAMARNMVKSDVADAKLSFDVIRNLRLPPQFHQTSLWSSTLVPHASPSRVAEAAFEEGTGRNIAQFFSEETTSMSRLLDNYKKNVDEVEEYLKGIEDSTIQHMHQLMSRQSQDNSNDTADNQVRELAGVLRAFESGILGVAAKMGRARETVQDVMLGVGPSDQRDRYRMT